jgi:hypothetical protein
MGVKLRLRGILAIKTLTEEQKRIALSFATFPHSEYELNKKASKSALSTWLYMFNEPNYENIAVRAYV